MSDGLSTTKSLGVSFRLTAGNAAARSFVSFTAKVWAKVWAKVCANVNTVFAENTGRFFDFLVVAGIIPLGLWLGQFIKPFLGWDELFRYVWYGIEKQRFTPKEVLGPLFDWFDNGVLTVVTLRFLRNCWPNDPEKALFVCKWFFASGVWCSFRFFLSRMFDGEKNKKLRIFILVGFIISPAVWMQWNVLMNEGQTLAFAFLWWAFLFRAPHFFRWKDCLLCSVVGLAFFLASFQLFFAWSVSVFAGLLLCNLVFRFQPPYRTFLVTHFISVLGAGILWNLFRIFQPLQLKSSQLFGHLKESRNTYEALAAGLEKWEYWFYGLRGFAWMVVPSGVVILFSVIGLGVYIVRTRKYFSNRAIAFSVTAIAQTAVYAYGYIGNLQDRYRFHSQAMLLVVVWGLCFFFIDSFFFKNFLKLKSPVVSKFFKRTLMVVCFGFFTGVAFFEYGISWREFSCLANSQHYGEYLYDSGRCDQIPRLVRYQNGKLKDRYPARSRNQQLPLPHYGEWKDRIYSLLEKGRVIHTSQNNPNFFLKRTIEYWYLLKFKEYPPQKGQRFQWIRLSLPETSRWLSTPYRDLEHRSDIQAEHESKVLQENFSAKLIDSFRSEDFVFEFLTNT